MKIITLLLFVFLAYAGFSQDDTLINWNELTKGNFKISYPKGWTIDTSKKLGVDLFIFSPLENKDDNFKENVNILIQDLSGQGINLNKYKQITEQQLNDMPGISLFESSVLKSEKGEYYKITYAMTQGANRLKILSLCFIKNNNAYLATFAAVFDKYDQYRNIGEKILNSFTLINYSN
jgi:hypothetical protein